MAPSSRTQPPASEAAAGRMTIDELARRSGTTTRTLRLYQTRGLMAPPVIVGRTGYYSEEHLKRLLMVDRLQKRGFSLASIAQLIEEATEGHGLRHLLGIEQAIVGPRARETPVVMSRDEIAQKLGGPIDEALISRAEAVGLLERTDGEKLRVLMPSVLDFGALLVRYGMPATVALAALEQLSRDTLLIVQQLAAHFRAHILGQMLSQPPDKLLPMLGELAGQLRESLSQVFLAMMHRAIDRQLAAFVPGLGAPPSDPTPGSGRDPSG